MNLLMEWCLLSILLPGSGSAPFSKDKIWDDGKAEVAAYEAEDFREGAKRKFVAYSILVKETLDSESLVKVERSNPSPSNLEALKFNWVLSVPAGLATYHQMTSVFFQRETMEPVKFSLTSSEWCGNTFKLFTRKEDRFHFRAHTYWEGMSQVETVIRMKDTIFFYDALPVRLRALDLETKKKLAVSFLPTQIRSKAERPVSQAAHILILGVSPDGYEVHVQHPKGLDKLWFSMDSDRIMTRWERWDGSRYKLLKRMRADYWNQTEDEDRDKLPRKL